MMEANYEAIIGLEVHVELKTATKIFCSCPTAFGAAPNTQCCPVCLGLPGALPTLNRRAVELGVLAGLAFDCEISRDSRMARKQYFYPDLPKSYQISQDQAPLCKNGHLTIGDTEGKERRIGIARIHIEEDAGKLMHIGEETYVDCNRAGVPLIEIVSEPMLHSGAEAVAYLKSLRARLVTFGISDCRMQEGAMRCDVNVSVRERGSDFYGVRTEIKNVNSFSFVEKAIKYEVDRQISLLKKGEEILSETRRYDEASGTTVRMRLKERAEDYRYLVEPDLLPIHLDKSDIERLSSALPERPDLRARRLATQYEIPLSDARVLVSERAMADYFEEAAAHSHFPEILVHLLLSDLLRFCRTEPFCSPVRAARLCEVADLMGRRVINSGTAKKLLIRLTEGDFSPAAVVEAEELGLVTDRAILLSYAERAMAELPRAVADYRAGKRAAMHALQGKMMAMSGGRADPERCEELLLRKLNMEEVEDHV